MQQWFVSSWIVGLLLKLTSTDTLGKDLAPFGWMMLPVMAPSLPCLTANTQDGVNMTVFTLSTLE